MRLLLCLVFLFSFASPSLADFIVLGSASSFSGKRECNDRCVERAIERAERDARAKCGSGVDSISAWSLFYGTDRRSGHGVSAYSYFRCLPWVKVALKN